MKGFHHFYLSIMIDLIAFRLIWTKVPVWIVVFIFGVSLWIKVDDIYQHIRQREDPDYRSFFHRWYGHIYRACNVVRFLNRVFDKIFGG